MHVATCLGTRGTTHRDRSNAESLVPIEPVRPDHAATASLQSNGLGALDDLPSRISEAISVQGTHWRPRSGLGGIRSANVAHGSRRALSRAAGMR